MKENTFWRLFWGLMTAGLAVTVAHLIYVIYAYQHCSIIHFIAKELW